MPLDLKHIRSQFPALNQIVQDRHPVFLDGPGGTQVPQSVLNAMTSYLGQYNSNLLDSPFFSVRETHTIVHKARTYAAKLLNCDKREIVFGANMTSLTAHISRSIALDLKNTDEIIVTALDHYANVSFWQSIAQDRGIKCHIVRIDPDTCTLDYEHLESLVNTNTKLIAFTLASNICGSKTDAQRIIALAQSVQALTYVDAVHYTAHHLPNVSALDCDFLVCSPYKFFGPHMGILFGKAKHLKHLSPYKVSPASDDIPDRWETGTKSFEALAGFTATIEYLCRLNSSEDHADIDSDQMDHRATLEQTYNNIIEHEKNWATTFLNHAKNLPRMVIHGIRDTARTHERTCTFAISIQDHDPQHVADHLARHGIATGASHFYAVGVTDALGLTDKGGVTRIGAVHYNTIEELEHSFNVLEML